MACPQKLLMAVTCSCGLTCSERREWGKQEEGKENEENRALRPRRVEVLSQPWYQLFQGQLVSCLWDLPNNADHLLKLSLVIITAIK